MMKDVQNPRATCNCQEGRGAANPETGGIYKYPIVNCPTFRSHENKLPVFGPLMRKVSYKK